MTYRETDYLQLLNAYRELWVNRSLKLKTDEGKNYHEKEILYEAIKKDLLDEMTHPRVRQPADRKLQLAKRRIEESNIEDHMKRELISLYDFIYDEVKST
ncbi:hypothetical protein ACFOU2_12095 [Bacillus songklensis]|uniref:Uncharacterized protein n=1 Tax=Bacillus songklensis TaxID=1069116 RepID=A0ABV8B1L5_9BACI